jgi:predicted nucleotide-binding protein
LNWKWEEAGADGGSSVRVASKLLMKGELNLPIRNHSGDTMPSVAPRPTMFIGSSSEGLKVAEHVQLLMERDCEAEIWSQGVFGLSQGTLESLILALERFDFAVLVLTADDLVVSRGATRPAARDNVIFELGLFIGALGRQRTFMVYDRTAPPQLPSDLHAITAAEYSPHASGNLEAALGPACRRIKNEVSRLGRRDSRRAQQLSAATTSVEEASARIDELLRLLARSRKVELDIISAQFGMFIDPTKLAEMQRDLVELEATLNPTENKPPFEEVWQRIVDLQGETFNTVTGLPFEYVIDREALIPSRTDYRLSRGNFEKAFARVPIGQPREINNDVRGPSYVWAILHDPRVSSGRW